MINHVTYLQSRRLRRPQPTPAKHGNLIPMDSPLTQLRHLSCCDSIPTLSSFQGQFKREVTMAAAIKAINAKIRSNKVLDYVFSTRMFTISRSLASMGGRSRSGLSPCLDGAIEIACWRVLDAIQAFMLCLPMPWASADSILPSRFLGPSLEFRYPDRRRDGHSERP